MDLRDFYLLAALIACLRLDSAIAQELIYTIREELPENVPIGNIPKDLNISHINAATGTSASLVYRLVSNAGASYAEENECFFELEVVILPNDFFRLIKIKIIVKDTNDNAPMFPSPVINISIPENTLINSRFPIPSATDPDTGFNGVQHYELLNGQSVFWTGYRGNSGGRKVAAIDCSAELG